MRKTTLLYIAALAAILLTGCFSFPKEQALDAIEQLNEPAKVEVITTQIQAQPKADATFGLTIIGGVLIIISQIVVFLGNPKGWLGVLAGAGIAAGPWIFDSGWFKWVAGFSFAALAIQLLIYGYQRFLKPFWDSRRS